MSDYETYSLWLAIIALLVSFLSLFISYKTATTANKISSKSIETDVKIAQRQGVVNLSAAWKDTSILADPIVVPDLVRSVNALSETAAAWNHDIIDRQLIDQLYYDSFSRIYDFVESKREELVPSLGKTYRSMLSSDIQKAYQDMKQFHLSQVIQTKILP